MSTDFLFILIRDHSFLMKFFRVHFTDNSNSQICPGKPDLTSTPPWCLLPSHQTPLNLLISRREKRSSSSIVGKCVLQVPTTSKDEVLCFFSAAAAQCSTVEKTTAEQSCFAFANELSHNLLEEEAILLRIALAGMDLLTATDVVSLQLVAEKANRLCILNVAKSQNWELEIFSYYPWHWDLKFNFFSLCYVISLPSNNCKLRNPMD